MVASAASLKLKQTNKQKPKHNQGKRKGVWLRSRKAQSRLAAVKLAVPQKFICFSLFWAPFLLLLDTSTFGTVLQASVVQAYFAMLFSLQKVSPHKYCNFGSNLCIPQNILLHETLFLNEGSTGETAA